MKGFARHGPCQGATPGWPTRHSQKTGTVRLAGPIAPRTATSKRAFSAFSSVTAYSPERPFTCGDRRPIIFEILIDRANHGLGLSHVQLALPAKSVSFRRAASSAGSNSGRAIGGRLRQAPPPCRPSCAWRACRRGDPTPPRRHPARTHDAPHLTDRLPGLGHEMQHEERHRTVELAVFEGQIATSACRILSVGRYCAG